VLRNLPLTRKIEFNNVASYPYVLWAQCCQSVAAVFIGVNLAPRPHKTSRQNPYNASHHPCASKPLFSQILPNDSSHSRDRLTKSQQTIELLLLASSYVIFVIDILPATGRVFPDSLKHSTGRSIDCYLGPCRREAKSIDPGEVGAAYFAAVGIDKSETSLSSQSPYARSLKSFEMSHQNTLVR